MFADDAERSIRRAANMQVTPGVDVDHAIQRMIELGRLSWLAMRALISETKRRTVQTRSSAASALDRRPVHDTALDQTHQQVGVDPGACERLEVIATLQRHDSTRAARRLGCAHRGDLLERDVRRRLGRWSPALHVEWQDPAARHIWD